MKKNVENEKLDINSAKTVNGDEDSGSFATSGLDDAPDFGPFLKSESGDAVQTFEFTDTDGGGFAAKDEWSEGEGATFVIPAADSGELPQSFGPAIKYSHEPNLDQDEPAMSPADQSLSKAVDLINDAMADNADQSESAVKGDPYAEHVELPSDVDFARPPDTFEG